MAKLIHYHRFESNFHFEAFFNQLLQVDFTKFTIRISLNSNLESLSFKFSLKASFCQKQFAPKSYFNLDFLYKFPESNSAKRILQNSIPNFGTENFELWVKFKIRHIFVLKCKIKVGKAFICQQHLFETCFACFRLQTKMPCKAQFCRKDERFALSRIREKQKHYQQIVFF